MQGEGRGLCYSGQACCDAMVRAITTRRAGTAREIKQAYYTYTYIVKLIERHANILLNIHTFAVSEWMQQNETKHTKIVANQAIFCHIWIFVIQLQYRLKGSVFTLNACKSGYLLSLQMIDSSYSLTDSK